MVFGFRKDFIFTGVFGIIITELKKILESGGCRMSNIEAAKQLYNTCKNMDIDETMQLVLSADNAEEQEFFSMLSDFILQQRQKEVIRQKRF